jgi:hypothetical protein
MSTSLFHYRCFLNEESGAAIVEAGLDDNSYIDHRNNERRPSFDGTLHITDCSRSIELSVNFGGENGVEDARKSLHKLDRLLDAVQGIRDALARAAKREFPGKKF